jgi:hypothetical protein
VKREHVSKTHLSLASVFKTVHAIFGLPALNQYDAAATDLGDLFTDTPDFRPGELRRTAERHVEQALGRDRLQHSG